jgi:hypothetical protein
MGKHSVEMASISAVYTSPDSTTPHQLMTSLSAMANSTNPTTDERVAHLAELQSSVKALQGDINAFLTQKMEQDNAADAKNRSLDEAKEEENYGEEVVEAD